MCTIKKYFTVFLSFLLIFLTVSIFPAAENTDTAVSEFKTSNLNTNNYSIWASTVNSYLYEDGGHYIRVEYSAEQKAVIVERYTEDFSLSSSQLIRAELPLFGGFYCSESYNFLVFGQTNPSESDSTEVIRIVKFTKDWTRLSSAGVYGANTYIPFEAGSLRFEESNGRLYLHTCHQMYQTTDGVHHQANMTIVLNTDTMTVTDTNYTISNTSTGYVSHSFNQFAAADTDSLLTVDHGDAIPRAVVLFRYRGDLGKDTIRLPENVEVFPIAGEIGDNETGVSLGGLTVTPNNYLIALNSRRQDSSSLSYVRNIYLTVTPKSSFQQQSTKTVQLTNYADSAQTSAGTPYMLDIGGGKYLLMWDVQTVTGSYSVVYNNRIAYVVVDENGNKLTDIYTADASLSDCTPLVSGNKVLWYVTKNSAPIFFSLNLNNLSAVTLEKCNHSYTETVLQKSTCTRDGKGRYTCVFCSNTYEAPIPSLGGHIDDGSGRCVTCGNYIPTADNTAVITWSEDAYKVGTAFAEATIQAPQGVALSALSMDASSYRYSYSSQYFKIGIADFATGEYDVYVKLSNGEVIQTSFLITEDGKTNGTQPPNEQNPAVPTTDPMTTPTDPFEIPSESPDEIEKSPSEETSEGKNTQPLPDANTGEAPAETEPEPDYILGDLDGNGMVEAADARIALRISAKLQTFDEKQLLAGDINKNGLIEATDARKILRVAAQIDTFA